MDQYDVDWAEAAMFTLVVAQADSACWVVAR